MESAIKTNVQLTLELQHLTKEFEGLKLLYCQDIAKRHKAEVALKESENNLSAVFNATDESIYLVKVDNTLMGLNDIAAKRMGGTQHDFIGNNIYSLLPHDIAASRHPIIDQVISTQKPVIIEDVRNERWMASRIFPILDEDGQVSRMAIFSRDVTDRKNAENTANEAIKALHEANKKLEAIVSASPDGIGIVSLDGKIELMSEKLATMYGYPIGERDENIGKSVFDFIDPSFHKDLINNIQKLFPSEKEHDMTEYIAIKKDNSRFYIEVNSSLIYDYNNKPSGILFIIRDITKRKQEEEKLRLSEENHHRLFEIISQGVVYIDEDGEIVSVNPAAESILGISANLMLGKYFINHEWGMIRADGSEIPDHENPMLIALNGGKPATDFIMGVRNPKNRDLLWLSLTLIPIIQPGEIKPYQLYLTFQDITQLKIRELLLKQKSDEFKVQNIELFKLNDSLQMAIIQAEKSESRFKEVLENSLVASYKRNLQTNIYEYFSPVITKITGFTPDDMKSLPLDVVLELIHPDDLPEINRVINLSTLGPIGSFYQVEYRFKRKLDDGYIWLFDQFTMVNDAQGFPVARIGSVSDITNRKLLEQDRIIANDLLAQTRQNYETFFNTIDDFLFVLDEQGNIVHVNNTVINRLGYTWDELSNKSVLEVHPPERRQEAGRIVGEMLQGITEFCPVPLITKTGIQIPVETRVKQGIWDGKPVIFGVTKDITRIQLSEEKFSKSFHLNPSACGLSDVDTHKYIEVNEAFYTLFGFNKNEVIGKTAFDLGIFTKEAANAILLAADNNGKVTNIEANLKAKNGELKFVHLSAENIYVQDHKYRFTVVYDITEQKLADLKLRETEERLLLAMDQSHLAYWEMDAATNTFTFNDQFYELYATTAEREGGYVMPSTVYAQNFLLSEDSHVIAEDIARLLSSKIDKLEREIRIRRRDGEIRHIMVRLNVVRDTNGQITGIRGSNQDITEMALAKEALKKSETELRELNATKDKFFSIIAHDLKSPFNAIMGFSDILVEQVREKDYEGIDEYAGYILQSSKRAMDLLSNLMEWSRSQTGRMDFNPEHFEMNQFLGDIIPLFENVAVQKSITITREFPSDIVAFADKAMISTVFRNLISNAIKFTQIGGVITLTITKEQNRILISVKDSGIGIPENMIGKLFRIDQSYSTTGTNNEQGTGLGLILCKEFVEKHGGTIWVDSEVGKGSTFYFTLPYKMNL